MQSGLDLAPDVIIGSRYRLVGTLARGGTSSVWRAIDDRDGREVALKILDDEGVDPALRSRAEREAQVLTDVHHTNLVRVLDSGVDDERPYLVMELLDGEPLNRILDRRGALDVEEAVRLVCEVADGLGVAHERGVIHRDVKPGNIVCDGTVPTLVDFGIARAMDATTLTRGLVVGTASYLAPEQAQGLSLTPAADVYALGCVLYELLTGQPPFDGDSPVTVALKHVQEDPRPPGDLADVPAAIDSVVMRCLAKEPGRRPADGARLAAALRAAIEVGATDETITIDTAAPVDGTMVMPAVAAPMTPTAEPAVLTSPAPIADAHTPVPPVAAVPSPPAARRNLVPAIVIGVVAGLLITAIAAAIGGGGDDRTRPVPDVTGAPVDDAVTYLDGAGLDYELTNVASDAPKGTVIATDPAPNAEIDLGGTVELQVSSGPAATPTTPAPAPEAVEEQPQEGGGEKPGKGNKKDD